MTELYRENVALIIRNKENRILIGERRDLPGNWQLPQGGVDEGESPETAVWRELFEETGLKKEHLTFVKKSTPVSYRFPEHAKGWRGFVGQRQVYFLLDLTSEDVAPEQSEEFVSWLWVSPKEAVARVVDFKKPVYEKAFSDIFGEGWDGD
jgi:putative (di)nucleoside polyphosphate hydrolase